MAFRKINAVITSLKDFCHFAKPGDYLEVCEWINGEGFNVSINGKNFDMTWGQFEALKKAVKKLNEI